MNFEEFDEILKKQAKNICIEINNQQSKSFYLYMQLLLEWNEKINLTTITDPKEIILKHFIDSLTIKKYINDDSSILDLGTGAGFPGIPLKILNEKNNITLLDSLNKRIIFLDEVISNLNMKNIKAIHGRAEEMGQNKIYREQYNVVVSRAVAKLNVLLEYMLPFVEVGGKCICMKGSSIEEMKEAEKSIFMLGGELEKIEQFTLPHSDINRHIIIIKKIKNTSSKYPRKAGMPAKEPIV